MQLQTFILGIYAVTFVLSLIVATGFIIHTIYIWKNKGNTLGLFFGIAIAWAGTSFTMVFRIMNRYTVFVESRLDLLLGDILPMLGIFLLFIGAVVHVHALSVMSNRALKNWHIAIPALLLASCIAIGLEIIV